MHPYITEAVARERIADMHRAAAAHRLARQAAAARAETQRERRESRRQPHRVELIWPDGVSTVVEVPQQSVPAHADGRGLTSSRR